MNLRFVTTVPTAVALCVLCLGATCASATVISSSGGGSYTGTIKAEAEGSTSLHSSLTTVTCSKSTIEGSVESHGAAVTAEGNVSTFSFSECGTADVTVESKGSLIAHTVAAGGTITSTGTKIKVQLTSLGVTCEYTTSSTHIGTLTDSVTIAEGAGGSATLDISGAVIPRTGGSSFCGSTGTWTASYAIKTPEVLVVSAEAAPPLEATPKVTFTGEGDKQTVTVTNKSDLTINNLQMRTFGNDSIYFKGSTGCAGTNLQPVKNAPKNACAETWECRSAGKGEKGTIDIYSTDPKVATKTALQC